MTTTKKRTLVYEIDGGKFVYFALYTISRLPEFYFLTISADDLVINNEQGYRYSEFLKPVVTSPSILKHTSETACYHEYDEIGSNFYTGWGHDSETSALCFLGDLIKELKKSYQVKLISDEEEEKRTLAFLLKVNS